MTFSTRYATRNTFTPYDNFNPRAHHAAEQQKARAEQQSAGQAPGKRNQIAFATSKTKERDRDKERDKDKDKDRGRFQPYGSGHREKSRWG